MEDFEWLSMTIICVVVALLVFQGASQLIRKGFKDIPQSNSEKIETIDKQQADFIEQTRRQEERARAAQERKMDAYRSHLK
ncbi:MAG: hypothetical protein HQL26_07120 [Candidatus Omnitrophica bacterium]|nr:hypothetical protein [Candidatus Omnitrophota bacterium]